MTERAEQQQGQDGKFHDKRNENHRLSCVVESLLMQFQLSRVRDREKDLGYRVY